MYRQVQLLAENVDLISTKAEDHWFDRKSARISPEALANTLVSFANADGGTVLVGVSNSGEIEGVESNPDRINALRRAAMDLTIPPVRHSTVLIPCTASDGRVANVLAFEIPPGTTVHRTHRDEVYVRVGDQTRKLDFDATLELSYDKGASVFDGQPVPGADYRELDHHAVEDFVRRAGGTLDPAITLKARGLLIDSDIGLAPTAAAVLLFGSHPDQFISGSFIRVLRYDGQERQYGVRSNVTFDQRITGALPAQIAEAEGIIASLIPSTVRLGAMSGRFETTPALPQFAWLEAVVNAVAHRSYSQQGDHIRVSLFDDRLEVSSPGKLPGPVRLDNIRTTRFARNPRIARVLADLKLVQELNEGVNRMFEEMKFAGLQDPVFLQSAAGFTVTLSMVPRLQDGLRSLTWDDPVTRFVLREVNETGRVTVARAIEATGLSAPTVRRQLLRLTDAGILERIARSATDPTAFWRLQRVPRDE